MDKKQGKPTPSRGPLLAMAEVNRRLAEMEPDKIHKKYLLNSAAKLQARANKEPA